MISPAIRFEVNQYALRLGLKARGTRIGWALYTGAAEVAKRVGEHYLGREYRYQTTRNRISELEDIHRKYPEISTDNPIHTIFAVEREVIAKSEKGPEDAYEFLNETIRKVKIEAQEHRMPLSSTFISRLLYGCNLWALLEFTLILLKELPYEKRSVFSLGLSGKEKQMDCKRSYLYLAFAHEFNWPLYLVTVNGEGGAGHAFVRWYNFVRLAAKILPKTVTEFDPTNEEVSITAAQRARERIISARDARKLAAETYLNCALVFMTAHAFSFAEMCLYRMVGLVPCDAEAYYVRGLNYERWVEEEKGYANRNISEITRNLICECRDYEKALELDPYYLKGLSHTLFRLHGLLANIYRIKEENELAEEHEKMAKKYEASEQKPKIA